MKNQIRKEATEEVKSDDEDDWCWQTCTETDKHGGRMLSKRGRLPDSYPSICNNMCTTGIGSASKHSLAVINPKFGYNAKM